MVTRSQISQVGDRLTSGALEARVDRMAGAEAVLADQITSSAGCDLCGLPMERCIEGELAGSCHTYCCHGCRLVHGLVADDLARGLSLPLAMGRAGLDLEAACCRGILRGDPAEEAERLQGRLMISAILSMMVMALSLALYSDLGGAWDAEGAGARGALQALLLLFATPVVLLLAVPILEDATLTWRIRRRPTTSALIAIGSLAAYGLSVHAVWTGVGHAYFETAAMTLLLVTLGRWLDAKTMVEGDKSLRTLLEGAPEMATRLMTPAFKAEERLPAAELRVGDRIRVRPGERFAVDGRILDGLGSVQEATITGESAPADKGPGDAVYAGTTSLDGFFTVHAEEVGEDRVLARLTQLLEEARLVRAPIERLADKVASGFVPAVILLALGAMVYWTGAAGFERGLIVALSVLLIACPCALGIATPLAIWTALGQAARHGVFIRDNRTLERLAAVERVCFDKTGTLTTGDVELSELWMESGIIQAESAEPNRHALLTQVSMAALAPLTDSAANPESSSEHAPALKLLSLVAAIEQGSEHPFGRAIRAWASAYRASGSTERSTMPMEGFRAHPGMGVEAKVEPAHLTALEPSGELERRAERVEPTKGSAMRSIEKPVAKQIEAPARLAASPLGQPGIASTSSLPGRITVRVGSPRFMEASGLRISPALAAGADTLGRAGKSVVFVGWSGRARAILGLREILRPEAAPTIALLKRRGHDLALLSGDGPAAAEAMGARLGIPAWGGLLPQDKAAWIQDSGSDSGLTAMVGDGLNDAPALGQAAVGIALGCGTDLASGAADLRLLGDDLSRAAWSLDLAKRTYRCIAGNLFFSFIYNLVGIGLALAGLLNPILAALFMVLSSVIVVFRSLGLRRFEPLEAT